ncbi:MAG TPA: abortive infection family protein [Acidobacteriota bacterium]|nr:abortive infection family protein [Acidobacteriota bacterium]HQQ45811.1 abortive infection family protein [Acidobacteriota bacterium]
MPDLISKKTRTEFREYFVGTTLRKITEEFDGADVPCSVDYLPQESGQRRSLVEQYYHAVNFASWRDVKKILRVYENVLIELEDRVKHPMWGKKDEYSEKKLSLFLRYLERDGFTFSNGRLKAQAQSPTVEDLSTSAGGLDSRILSQQIDRMRNSIEDDPDLAIGTAKELVETTCRTILADYGVAVDIDWDVIRLVKETRKILKLIPEDIPDNAKGAQIIKKLLGSLGQVSQGIAELRNLYGTGHGRDGQFKGLGSRHARLAVGAATALATFLFETYELKVKKTI